MGGCKVYVKLYGEAMFYTLTIHGPSYALDVKWITTDAVTTKHYRVTLRVLDGFIHFVLVLFANPSPTWL